MRFGAGIFGSWLSDPAGIMTELPSELIFGTPDPQFGQKVLAMSRFGSLKRFTKFSPLVHLKSSALAKRFEAKAEPVIWRHCAQLQK